MCLNSEYALLQLKRVSMVSTRARKEGVPVGQYLEHFVKEKCRVPLLLNARIVKSVAFSN
jgi:hypothetical protein